MSLNPNPCPNTNSPEWKLLVSSLGEDGAHKVFISNNYSVPEMNVVEKIINKSAPTIPTLPNKTGLQSIFNPEELYRRVSMISGEINTELYATIQQGEKDLEDVDAIIAATDLTELRDKIFLKLLKVYDGDTLNDKQVEDFTKMLDHFDDFEIDGVTHTGLFNKSLRALSGKGFSLKTKRTDAAATDSSIATEGTVVEDETSPDEVSLNTTVDAKESWQEGNLTKDYKDTISTKVRQAIRILKDYKFNSATGIMEPVTDDFNIHLRVNEAQVVKQLANELSNIFDPDLMFSKLAEMGTVNPLFDNLLETLNNDPYLKSQFFFTFAKYKATYGSILVEPKSEVIEGTDEIATSYQIRFAEANRFNVVKELANKWAVNLASPNNNKITKLEGGVNKIDVDLAKKYKKDYENELAKLRGPEFEFAPLQAATLAEITSAFGFDFTPEQVFKQFSPTQSRKGTISPQTNLHAFLENVTMLIQVMSIGHNPYTENTENRVIKNIASRVSIYDPNIITDNFLNIENKPMYSYIVPNFIAKTEALITGDNWKEYVDQYANDPFYKDSYILNRLQSVNGRETLKFYVLNGIFNQGTNESTKYTKMGNADIDMLKINAFLFNGAEKQGLYLLPVLSDAPNGVFMRFDKQANEAVIEGLVTLWQQETARIQNAIDTKTEYASLFADYVAAEGEAKVKAEAKLRDFNNNFVIKNYHTTKDITGLKIDWNGNAFRYQFLPDIQALKDSGTTVNESNIREHITNMLEAEFESTVAKWTEIGLINKAPNGRIVTSGTKIDTASATKLGGMEAAIRNYVYNSTFMNAQSIQLLGGDLAYYKPAKGTSSLAEDFAKRFKEVWSPAQVLNVSAEEGVGTTYRTMYVKDIEIGSKYSEAITEALNLDPTLDASTRKAISSAYTKDINIADAQGYTTLDRYVKVMKSKGEWSPKHEAALDRIKKEKHLNEDLLIFLKPLKPFMFGHYKVGNKMVPIQNKNSEIPLIPALIKGNKSLQQLNDFMVKNKIDSVQFNSTVKVGEYGTTDLVSDEKGQYTNLDNLTPVTLSNFYYGLQQEIPTHHIDDEQLHGTQIRRIIMADLDITDASGQPYKYTIGGKEMTAKEIFDEYNDLIVKNIIEAYDKTASDILNPTTGELNYQKIQDMLYAEFDRRGEPEKLYDAVKIITDEAGKKRFNLPLYDPTISQKSQAIINSIFKNAIVKQRLNGAGLVQVSGFGWSDKVKPVRAEDGKIVAAEVMLPAYSKKFFEHAIDPITGEVDMRKVDKRALQGVGYRIPTEGKYSMLPFKIVGFLPESAGPIIIVPEEITKQAGSDFDIDKMYIMLKNIKLGVSESNRDEFQKDLNKELKKYTKLNKIDVEELLTIINENKFRKTQGLKEVIPEGWEEIFKERKEIISKIVSKHSTLIANNNLEHKEGRDNRIIDITQGILLDKAVYGDLMAPGGPEDFKDIANIINEWKGVGKNAMNTILPSTQTELFLRNTAGKALIGIFANQSANHVTGQWGNIELAEAAIIYNGTPLKSFNNIYTLRGGINDTKVKISKALGALVAAATDNAKDPILTFLNISDFTADIQACLIRMGMHPEDVSFFLTQESIVNLYNDYVNGGATSISEFQSFKKQRQFYIDQLASLGVDAGDQNFIKQLADDSMFLNSNELKKDLKQGKEGREREFYINQLRYLNAFENIKKAIKPMQQFIQVARPEATGTGPTVFDNIYRVRRKDKLIENDKILGVKEIFGGNNNGESTFPMIKAFYDYGIHKPNQIIAKLFPYNTFLFTGSTDQIELESGKSLTSKNRQQIADAIMSTQIANLPIFNNMKVIDIRKMFKDPKENIATKLDNFKKTHPEIAKGVFLSKLDPIFINPEKKIENAGISFNNLVKLSNFEKEQITNDWEVMLFHPDNTVKEFAEDLVKYNFYKTGYSFGGNSFWQYTPNSFLINQNINDIYEGINNSKSIHNINYLDNMYMYYRNNINSNDYVLPKEVIKKKGKYVNVNNVFFDPKSKLPSHITMNLETVDEQTMYVTEDGFNFEPVNFMRMSHNNVNYLFAWAGTDSNSNDIYVMVPSTTKAGKMYRANETLNTWLEKGIEKLPENLRNELLGNNTDVEGIDPDQATDDAIECTK